MTANRLHEFYLILFETILNWLSKDLSDASTDPLLFLRLKTWEMLYKEANVV